MLDTAMIDQIVNGAVLSALRSKGDLRRVYHEPALDSDGEPAIHVVVVLDEDATTRIDGDMALDAIYCIQRRLTEAGEGRFPIIDFATETELENDGGR